MKRLREDDAVVPRQWQCPRVLEVSDQCGPRVGSIDVDDGAFCDAIRAESGHVDIVLDFEHRSMDQFTPFTQERLDVSTVERRASVETVVIAQRLERKVGEGGHETSLSPGLTGGSK